MKWNRYFLVPSVLAALAVTSLAVDKPVEGPEKQMRALAEGNNNFAFDLYAKLRTTEGNLFLSPYSISTALAMTCAGAVGHTSDQMEKVLRFPDIHYKLLHSVDFETGKRTGLIESERMRKDDIAAAFGNLQRGLRPDPNEKPYELSIA
ncbi:MAG: serpin family protein, partial [Planctomycetota bacterium]